MTPLVFEVLPRIRLQGKDHQAEYELNTLFLPLASVNQGYALTNYGRKKAASIGA